MRKKRKFRVTNNKKYFFLLGVIIACFMLPFISANGYVADVTFTIRDSVLVSNETISLKGSVYQTNYTDNGTLVSASAKIVSASVNLTIENKTRAKVANYTLITNSVGDFYSNGTFTPTWATIRAPSANGTYYIVASYIDPNSTRWFSEVEFTVVNFTIDTIRVSAQKANYNPSESMKIDLEAIKLIGDKILYVSNISINGSIRNSTLGIISSFNCTTEASGKCTTNVNAPSSYGSYILEVDNFKTIGYFSVVPFFYNLYMKDDLGKSQKNVFAIGEQARVEVSVTNASTNDVYTFSGYIVDSAGNVVQTINSTNLNSNNSFTNSFLFTVDALTYGYKAYRANVNVTKSGDGSISSATSFEVKDWILTINKKVSGSGFEYEYSVFPNKTMKFEAYPTFRANGSVIQNINVTFFTINLNDEIGNFVSNTNLTWNATCGRLGCYEFSLNSSTITGRYSLSVSLAYGGIVQTKTQSINVISGALTAQPTDKDGIIKELFGTNEFVYLSLLTYNDTSLQYNLSDAEVFLVRYMNGTEMNYSQVANFTAINATNTVNEWAWNITSQRLKLDVPKIGGVYNIFIYGNNKTFGASARFIVNPYDSCISAKDTPGTVGAGNYYVWQFKTTDTIYFEIKLTQANNPTGKATALNSSQNSSSTLGGLSSACSIDTATKQVVSNATLTVLEVRNTQSGALQNINTSSSVCQASDSSGGYSCTVKPLTKWEGGISSVNFLVQGQDGTLALTDGRFEARAFYLYGYSNTWQNGPNSNVSLTLRLYEAGGNWWGGGGSSGGLSGSVTLKKVEYMGRDGEWIWPPVDSGYNVSNISSLTITSGSGTMNLLANATQIGSWKTGYYRAIMQATTSSGDTDYGYAWFGVKLWDVYGMPIECTTFGCNYKSYFNSKENVTLFVKISQAGDYSYSAAGGVSLGGGNVTVSVKKVQDCRSWPCKELNSSDFTATSISVNESSPWYWNANISKYGNYILSINKTNSRWNTGWYSVVLDVNGSDSGYAYFSALAFYVDTQPVNNTGTGYKYSLKGNQPMYFNVTTTKNYKWAYSYGSSSLRYNTSDYVNATVDNAILRVWNQSSQKQIEYTYPNHFNASFVVVNNSTVYGNGLLNVSFLNGTSWPSGYYWGELTLKSFDNELSTGWLWFNIKPFRVQLSSNTYSIDSDLCINATLSIYDPDWSSSTPLTGNNYTIINVNENVWSGAGSSIITYTNYTNTTINATANVTFCPNSGTWGSGSWGGYHYLNVLVKDNLQNDSETGWLSFRTIPFQISWGSISGGTNKATNANLTVPVNLTKSTGGAASGNLTSIYQWRYDSTNGYSGTKETYVFNVGNCWSNVSGQCNITGFQNVTIYPPSTGWKVGYNYLQATWSKVTDTTFVEDWQGIYLEGREAFNGYFSNVDSNGNWKYYFNTTENITIKLTVRDSNYNGIAVNITNIQYVFSDQNCYSEWCRTYTSASWGIVGGGGIALSSNGNITTIKPPSSGWAKGDYYIKATVSGSGGTASITGGYVKVKDFIVANITVVAPGNNITYTTTNLSARITTSKNAQCSFNVNHYGQFHNFYCGSWNVSSNNGSWTPQTLGACNTSLYSNYLGNRTYYEYVSDQYRSTYNGSSSTWSTGTTGLTTGGTTHTYNFNTTLWPNNQYYGLQMYCWDNDYNSASSSVAFKVQI